MSAESRVTTEKLLLCTDMDRTLLPNGPQHESRHARDLFGRLVALPHVELAFVTGRDKKLVEKAIHNYRLPQPDFVIGDVGSTIYQTREQNWHKLQSWEDFIGEDWEGFEHGDLRHLLADINEIRIQEFSKQGTHKLSYYIPLHVKTPQLMSQIDRLFKDKGIKVNLVWSLDEPANVGLLDILPARASKRQAIEFLMSEEGYTLADVVFAGDSGNDISVMASEIPSVLVANASEEVRAEAQEVAMQNGQQASLYIATGGYLGMNGNYSAGILEGVAHYKPALSPWLKEMLKESG